MKNFYLALALLAAFISGTFADAKCIPVETWEFQNAGSQTQNKILTGVSLTDPSQHLTSYDGTYLTTILREQLAAYNNPTLYIPAAGGLVGISINGSKTSIPIADYAGTGPLLSLGNSPVQSDTTIGLSFRGDRSSYSGLWKSAPLICEETEAVSARKWDTLWQKEIPSGIATICLGLSILFGIIFLYTGQKFPIYRRFSVALILWIPYFLFLSGTIREFNYTLGTSALFPSRLAASLGLLVLFYSFDNRSLNLFDKSSLIFSSTLAALSIYLGIAGKTTYEVILYGLSIPSQIPALYRLISQRRTSARALIIASLAALTLSGEVADFFKILGPSFGLFSPLPYLNRVTLPPILFSSTLFFLFQFISYFRETQVNKFRHRILGHLALRITRTSLTEASLVSLARAARRLYFAKRSSVAKRLLDGSYEICGVSGFISPATGTKIDQRDLVHIRLAIETGELKHAFVSTKSKRYGNNFSLAVPIPLRPNPDYIVLISDISNKKLFSESDLNLSRQFYATLSSALIADQEREKAAARERERQDLIQKIDPDLFMFVQRNSADGIPALRDTGERGVVYFDQKSYTTHLQTLSPELASNLLQHVKRWVSRSGLRFNARPADFGGDAWLIEVFPLVGEARSQTISRTTALAWDLCEGLSELNAFLVKDGFEPITFRFGAHFGQVAKVAVDLAGGTKSLIGHTVNIAQRIQSQAFPGTVFVSGTVAENTSDHFIFQLFEQRKYVKGISGEITVFRLIGRKTEIEMAS